MKCHTWCGFDCRVVKQHWSGIFRLRTLLIENVETDYKDQVNMFSIIDIETSPSVSYEIGMKHFDE